MVLYGTPRRTILVLNGSIYNPLKNHFGVKWFYIEPPEEPFWCQMVLYRTL